MRQAHRITVTIVFVVTLAVLGALIVVGGREASTCPHGAGANVVQPKEGPGRPPTCSVKGP